MYMHLFKTLPKVLFFLFSTLYYTVSIKLMSFSEQPVDKDWINNSQKTKQCCFQNTARIFFFNSLF